MCFRVHVIVWLINLFNLEHVTSVRCRKCVRVPRVEIHSIAVSLRLLPHLKKVLETVPFGLQTRSLMRVELLLVKLKVRPECPPLRPSLSARVITIDCIT